MSVLCSRVSSLLLVVWEYNVHIMYYVEFGVACMCNCMLLPCLPVFLQSMRALSLLAHLLVPVIFRFVPRKWFLIIVCSYRCVLRAKFKMRCSHSTTRTHTHTQHTDTRARANENKCVYVFAFVCVFVSSLQFLFIQHGRETEMWMNLRFIYPHSVSKNKILLFRLDFIRFSYTNQLCFFRTI